MYLKDRLAQMQRESVGERQESDAMIELQEKKKLRVQGVLERAILRTSKNETSIEHLTKITKRFKTHFIGGFDLHFLMVKDFNVVLGEDGQDQFLWRGVHFEEGSDWKLMEELRDHLESCRFSGWIVEPRQIDGTWELVVEDENGKARPWPLHGNYLKKNDEERSDEGPAEESGNDRESIQTQHNFMEDMTTQEQRPKRNNDGTDRGHSLDGEME